MKKFLLSAIAIFAMTICSFAQMPVCENACAPHENAADYSTGVIPTYPTAFAPLTVGVPVDQCISIKIPSQISGSAINSALGFINITVNTVTVNGLVGLPDGLEACASENPMAANGTYTLRITGTPTRAGEYPLNMRAELDGPGLTSMANTYTNSESGVSTNITITVVEAGGLAANFSTNPAATGMLSQAVHITEGETVAFSDLSTGADHIAWTFEGGSPATSTAANVTVTYATAGTYTATLTAYNADESQSDTKSVSIEVAEASAAPVVFTVDFTADHTTIVTGQTVNFTNLTTATQNGQPYTGEIFYSWSFDADGGVAGILATSSEANPSYSYTTAGTYSVKLAVSTSQYGVYTTADTLVKHAYITVEEDALAVIADFTTTPEATSSIFGGASVNIMVGESIVYTSACDENTTSIEWTFQGGDPATSTDNQVTVTYAATGTYTTTLVAYGAEDRQSTKTLTVNVSEPAPVFVVDFTADVTTINVGQTVNFTNQTTATLAGEPYTGTIYYQWNFEADNILGGLTGTTSTDENASYTYTTAGVYSVSLAASDSEISILNSGTVETKEGYITVTDPVAVEENAISEISVYPNPASSIINVAAEGMQNITIIDMTGRVVMSKDVNSNFETISAEGFAKANYMVRIATADGVVVKNIVVE